MVRRLSSPGGSIRDSSRSPVDVDPDVGSMPQWATFEHGDGDLEGTGAAGAGPAYRSADAEFRHRLVGVLHDFEAEQASDPVGGSSEADDTLAGLQGGALPVFTDGAVKTGNGAAGTAHSHTHPGEGEGICRDMALHGLMEPIAKHRERARGLEKLDENLRSGVRELQAQAEEARSAFNQALSSLTARTGPTHGTYVLPLVPWALWTHLIVVSVNYYFRGSIYCLSPLRKTVWYHSVWKLKARPV